MSVAAGRNLGDEVFLSHLENVSRALKAQVGLLMGCLDLHPCAPPGFKASANGTIQRLVSAVDDFRVGTLHCAVAEEHAAGPTLDSIEATTTTSPGEAKPSLVGPPAITKSLTAIPTDNISVQKEMSIKVPYRTKRPARQSSKRTPKMSDPWSDLHFLYGDQVKAAAALSRRDDQTVADLTPCLLRRSVDPNSMPRVTWDLVGLLMMLYDLVMVPFTLAWNTSQDDVSLILACTYWALHIPVSFVTGYYKDGMLVASRSRIAKRYICSWLTFDLSMVCLDIIILVESGGSSGLMIVRNMRAIRLFRLLRMLNIRRMSQTLEDVSGASLNQKVLLVFAICKMFLGILFVVHILACLWYFLGRMSRESHQHSWLDTVEAASSPNRQYTHAFHWVLAQFTPAPIDFSPENQLERVANIVIIMFSLLAIGSSVSKMTSTIVQLDKMNRDVSQAKKQLQRYLRDNHIPMEMSLRIVHFVQHSMKLKGDGSALLGLLPQHLKAELDATYRSRYVAWHPLFSLVHAADADIFTAVCVAFNTHTYEACCVVFKAGDPAECMYVTVKGTYVLKDCRQHELVERSRQAVLSSGIRLWSKSGSIPAEETDGVSSKHTFSDTRFLADVALFSKVAHGSGLTAVTFADAFSISDCEFLQCVKRSPICVGMIYEFAKDYLSRVSVVDDLPNEEDEPLLVYDYQSNNTKELACSMVKTRFSRAPSRSMSRLGLLTQATMKQKSMKQSVPEEEEEEEEEEKDEDEVALDRMTPRSQTQALLARLLNDDLSEDEVIEQVPEMFRELDEEFGTYAKLAQNDERKRCLCAIVCALWFVRDRYDSFVQCQSQEARMTVEVWSDFQEFTRWTDMDSETLCCVMAFLALRGLGKSDELTRMCPSECSGPEMTVLHIMNAAPHLVPSVDALTNDMRPLLEQMFTIHATFNFFQMAQGENIPSCLWMLKATINEKGERVLKMYLFALVAIMCGLGGAKCLRGSSFMDEKNGRNVVLALHCLRKLDHSDPRDIYWQYIAARARQLKLATESLEDLAFARILCINRVLDMRELVPVQHAWGMLSASDKSILTEHFLADGISEKAFVLMFLPLYFGNARNNAAVGVHRALIVLVELLELLRIQGCAETTRGMTITVDISDLAKFASEVRSSIAFETAPEHVAVLSTHRRTWLVRIKKDLRAVTVTDQLPSMSRTLKQVARKQDSLEIAVMRVQHACSSCFSQAHQLKGADKADERATL